MPPPMSLHTLALEHKPVDVALSMSGTRLAVLSGTDLAVYALDMSKRPVSKPTLVWRSDALQGHSPRHVVFSGDEQIFVLTDNWDEDESCLWRSEGQELLPQGPIMEADHASFLSSSVDYQEVYIQLQNGALHRVNTDESSADLPPQTSLVHKFPAFAAEAKTVTADGQVRTLTSSDTSCLHFQALSFGLTKSGVLFANERILVRNCTSFVVTSAHLIFTTTQHLLKFVHLTSIDGECTRFDL